MQATMKVNAVTINSQGHDGPVVLVTFVTAAVGGMHTFHAYMSPEAAKEYSLAQLSEGQFTLTIEPKKETA